LAAIVTSSDDVIVSKTLEGVITSWNPAAERILGYTAEEAVGKNIKLIIPPDRWAEEDDVLARIRRGERVEHFETVRRAKNGRLLNLSVTVSPVRDATGRVVGASKVARDITDRIRAERELERLLASRRVVPIINENDTVAVEELRFGDNDRLSAEVARLVRADLLILLTNANGLTQDGDPEGEPIPEVADVESVAHLASAERGQFSVGGMASKLQAVKLAVDSGIPAVIGHGRKPGVLTRIVAGESIGTRFTPPALGQ